MQDIKPQTTWLTRSDARLLIAELRNRFATGKIDSEPLAALQQLPSQVDFEASPFREIFLSCISNAHEDGLRGLLRNGLNELQIIHNLPLDSNEAQGWDAEHFFSIELFSYIENCDEWQRVRALIVNIGKGLQRTQLAP